MLKKKEKPTPNKLNSGTNVIFTVCIESTVTGHFIIFKVFCSVIILLDFDNKRSYYETRI